MRLVWDGAEVATDAASPGCGPTVGPVGNRKLAQIGNDETATLVTSHDRSFRGNIDEVRISPRAPDPREFLDATHDSSVSFDTVLDGCEDKVKSFACALDGSLTSEDEGETYAAAGFDLAMTLQLGGALALTELDPVCIPAHQIVFYLSNDTTLDDADALLGTLATDRVAKSFANAPDDRVAETDEGNKGGTSGALPALPRARRTEPVSTTPVSSTS